MPKMLKNKEKTNSK